MHFYVHKQGVEPGLLHALFYFENTTNILNYCNYIVIRYQDWKVSRTFHSGCVFHWRLVANSIGSLVVNSSAGICATHIGIGRRLGQLLLVRHIWRHPQ